MLTAIQHKPKLLENNVLRPKSILFRFQVQLNANMNIELYAMYAVLIHVL